VNRDRLPLPQPPPAPPAGRPIADWLRTELAPSALRRSWRLHLGISLLLTAAGLLVGWSGSLPGWQQAALWGALLAVAAVLSRRGWLRLFGPVLFYDLVRTARRGRNFLLRGAYALALLVVLFLVYATYISGDGPLDTLFGDVRVGIQELADFGSGFFLMFLGVQFGAVFLLTPAFTATAIAEEKERRTLEYLLATDLHNREIVLGKLASRLLAMLLLLLGGLPVLSLVQFLGGVDPNLVLAGFAATAISMLSLGSLGILNSVWADRPRGAVFSTYVEAATYLLVSSCCGATPGGPGGWGPLAWFGAGNIVVAYRSVTAAAGGSGGTTGAAVLSVLSDYVVFHGIAAVVFAGLATLSLRAWNREARPTSEREAAVARPALEPGLPPPRRVPRLPRVGDDPILWKELYAERGFQLHWLARGLLTLLWALFLAGAGITYLCGILLSLAFAHPSEYATDWVRVVGTIVGCLMIVAVGVRAATTFSIERERQTLDSLLTTPLPDTAILGGKWLGALLSVRQAWWCLAAVWLLGFLAGGLHLLSLLMLAAAWWGFAAFAASLGLWLSLHCRTTFRAIVWTLVTLLVAGGLPSLLCGTFGWALLGNQLPERTVTPAELLALTPPGAMAYLAFGWGEWYTFDANLKSSVSEVAVAWVGVCGYVVAAAALWFVVGVRFGAITGRMSGGQTKDGPCLTSSS
jgi:ABC-type transport system involved in multi-copper enzyme maturation permease subunit